MSWVSHIGSAWFQSIKVHNAGLRLIGCGFSDSCICFHQRLLQVEHIVWNCPRILWSCFWFTPILATLIGMKSLSSNRAKAEVLAALYGRLNLNLVRANATAILSRCFVPDY
ncbi:hypothetical protein EMCRGX_G000553 [Ephydatia muelleri]